MTTSRTAYASLPGLFLIAARAVVESGRHNLPPLTDGESLAWAGVNRSGAILLVLDGENHILREYAILLADNEHEDGVFAECALILPCSQTAHLFAKPFPRRHFPCRTISVFGA